MPNGDPNKTIWKRHNNKAIMIILNVVKDHIHG